MKSKGKITNDKARKYNAPVIKFKNGSKGNKSDKLIGSLEVYDESCEVLTYDDLIRCFEYLDRPRLNLQHTVIATDIHKWKWVAFSHPSPDKD